MAQRRETAFHEAVRGESNDDGGRVFRWIGGYFELFPRWPMPRRGLHGPSSGQRRHLPDDLVDGGQNGNDSRPVETNPSESSRTLQIRADETLELGEAVGPTRRRLRGEASRESRQPLRRSKSHSRIYPNASDARPGFPGRRAVGKVREKLQVGLLRSDA